MPPTFPGPVGYGPIMLLLCHSDQTCKGKNM